MKKNERNWYNNQLSTSKEMEFYSKYPNYSAQLMDIARSGSLEDFRLLCNVLAKSSYNRNSYFSFNGTNYNERKELVKLCNQRTSDMLGNLLPTFELLKETQKHERWTDDERYKLFSYDFASYEDRVIILSTLELFVDYIGKPLSIENLERITYLTKRGVFGELVSEITHTYDWENNDEDWEKVNSIRKEHIEKWIQLMDYIYDSNYEVARQMLKK